MFSAVIAEIRHTQLPTILPGDNIFLTILSSARFLRFPQRNWPFPVSPAELSRHCCHCFFHSLTYVGLNRRRILLTEPADIFGRNWLTSFWIVLHLSLSGTPSLALLPFLTFGLDLGGVPQLLGLREIPPCHHPPKGVVWHHHHYALANQHILRF